MRWWPPWPAPSEVSARRPHLPRLRGALRAERLLAVGLALLTAALYLAGLFERQELIAIDFRYQAFPAPIRPDILLVLIDADSVKRGGQWPWPRSQHARLMQRLNEFGARAIGYDVEFGKARVPADDARLAATVAEARNIVLAVFHEYQRLPGGAEVYRVTPLMPELRRVGGVAGTIALPTDRGGGIRRARLAEEVGGEAYWAFSVELARLADRLPGAGARWLGPGRLRLGSRIIRGDRDGLVYVDYAGGRGSFPSVSAVDVLEGHVRPEDVRGKVALVGASAIELQDLHPTPFPGVMPGVEIQANLVNGVLRGVAARRLPPWVALVGLAILVAAWPPAASRVVRGPERMATRAVRLLAASGVVVAALAAAAGVLFWQWRIFLDVVPLTAGAIAMGLATVAVEAVRTGRRAALSAVALVPALPEEAGPASMLDRAVDVMFAALRDWMEIEVLVLEIPGADRRPEPTRVVRASGDRELGESSAACREWTRRALGAREGLLVARLGEAFGVTGHAGSPMFAVGSAFVPLLVGGRGIGVLHVHRSSAPFDADDLHAMGALAAQLALAVQNLELLQDLQALHLGTMAALADAVEVRDAYTGGHCKRVSDYAVQLAQAIGLPAAEVEDIRLGALIHDIGKIGIADAILQKAARLTDEERRHMQEHTVIGERIVAQLPVSRTVRDVILHHHERFDGSGYPQGLRGEAIPIAARIVAIADTYEALRGGRVYRAALPRDEVLAELRGTAGGQLDAHLVERFLHLVEYESGGGPQETLELPGDDRARESPDLNGRSPRSPT